MATKKAASTAKKTTSKKSPAKKPSTTVTTVKAVESSPGVHAAATAKQTSRFSLARTPIITALVAEFIGTFTLAAATIAGQGQPILVFFALVGVVLAVGTISGAYVNPALAIGGWLTRRITGLRALGYVVAQILGAMLALVILNAYMHAAPAASPSDIYGGAAQLFKAAALPGGKEWYIFFAEVMGALILGFAMANATRERKERTAAAFTVGLGIFLGLIIAGSAATLLGANAILNPAVAISLQAISFASIWPIAVYVVGTSLGAVVGFVLYDLLRGNSKDIDQKTA